MEISTAGHKTICVPVPSEADYQQMIKQGTTFRSFLDAHVNRYPELFQQRFPPATASRHTTIQEAQPRHSTD